MLRGYLYDLATDKAEGFFASFCKIWLFIFSLIYGLSVRLIMAFSSLRVFRLNAKVISVGNITLGGTGKTSLVEYLAAYLKENNHKVAVLSRGYKGKITNYKMMADEPYMLKENLKDIPVLVDKNRVRLAYFAVNNYGLDTVILDDGFQQWRLKKDLEIVTLDVTNPFGNFKLIPRGILRQPISSLKKVDIFILTKTNLKSDYQTLKNFLNQINPRALIFESVHKPLGFYQISQPNNLLALDYFKHKSVTLFSGIADPDSFENLVLSLGINIGLSFRFSDHYSYTKHDLKKIIEESENKGINIFITTQKDAFRLKILGLSEYIFNLFVLKIALKIIKNEEEFNQRLLKLYFS